MSGDDKPDPGEDFGIASSCAALADAVPPLGIVRYAVDAEERATAWQAVAIKAATRTHDMHVAAGEYPTYFTWHDCHHPACKAFRADALNTTPPEIQL